MGFFDDDVYGREKKKGCAGPFILVPVIIVAVIILAMCVRVVDTGEVAVVTQFGEVKGTVSEGLHAKSPFEEYNKILVTQQQVEEIYFTATKDIQSIDQQIVTQIVVDPSMAESLYRKFKGNHIDSIVKPILYDGFKSATAGFTLEEAIAKRDELSAKMHTNVKDSLAQYGIAVISVEIKDVQIPEDYRRAVEEKKVAEQVKARAETEKQTAIIRAEQELEVRKLEAEANLVVTESLTEQILQKMYLERWDGKLPSTLVGDSAGMNMILPTKRAAE